MTGQTLGSYTKFVFSRRMIWWKDRSVIENFLWRFFKWAHFFWNSKIAWRMTYLGVRRADPFAAMGFGSPFDIDHAKWWWKINQWLADKDFHFRGKYFRGK